MSHKNIQKFRINLLKKAKSLIFVAAFLFLFGFNSAALALPDCSDPAISDAARNPGVNCIISSCASLPGGAAPRPNINCALQSCATISGNPVLTGGGANCSYLNLPTGLQPCSATVNSNCNPLGLVLCSSLAPSNRNPRVNCANLIDLPLYSDIKVDAPNNHYADAGKNSVLECPSITNPDPLLVVGVDYAVHNKDCVRFCDNVEAGITPVNGVNCITRKCNQIIGTNPISTTSGADCSVTNCCAMQSCDLLTSDELNDSRFQNDAKKYCNGDGIKCYNFTQDKLQFLIPRANNPMCILHDCPPPSNVTSCGTDDTINITNKGTDYTNQYKTSICAGLPLSQMCNPISCLPVIERPYRCSPPANVDPPPTIPDPACDQTGPNSSCDSSGFCYLTIDCNLSPNQPECSTGGADSTPDNADDVTDAWFYRPAPMSKATDGNGNIRTNMRPELCYSKSNLEANGWGWDGEIDMGLFTIPLGYFHSAVLPDHSRSPGACGVNKIGNRGTGYLYLCKTHSLLYHSPDPKGVYIVNYGRANYELSDPQYYIKACTRFKNTLAIDDNSDGAGCGKRECAITCGFGWCSSQVCGSDKCVDLAVKDSNPTECAMSNGLFTGDSNKDCLGKIDAGSMYGGVRIRAVKYGDRICAFFDARGHLAYDQLPYSIDGAHYFTGDETLDDGTCVSGSPDVNGGCSGGFDTTKNEGTTSNWRTLFTVSYIGNILPSSTGKKGYYDKAGTFFKSQQCAKIPLRVGPPKEYNLANIDNSPTLFYPPLVINSVKVKRGGLASNPGLNQAYGATDFFFPEFEVGFGTTSQLMSLGIGYTGYENGNAAENDTPSSPATTTLSTTVNTIPYSVDIFVRKEFDQSTLAPLFCLYQKVVDINGLPLDPVQIVCVNRQYPQINNYLTRIVNSSIPITRTLFNLDPASLYYNAQMGIRYLANVGPNAIDNSCNGDDVCSPAVGQLPIILGSEDINNQTCNYGVGLYPAEQFPLCVQRDFCSQLNVECVVNEVNYYNAEHDGQTTDFSSFINVRNNCNTNILPLCNARAGIPANLGATMANPNPGNLTPDPNAYGWFNEICVTTGFTNQLRQVISYQVNNAMGKCLIDPVSPYLNDSNPATNCDAGGNAPNCFCLAFDPNINNLGNGQIVRQETPHEAGLCVDIPIPQTCPAITYNLTPNSDITDLDYVYQSINNSVTSYPTQTYGNLSSNPSNGVDLSHKYRNIGNVSNPVITLEGHADFPLSFPGMTNVFGICKGFWQNAIVNNVSIPPTLSCINNNGVSQWSGLVSNPCIRYSCQPITTLGPDNNGNYQGDYGVLENGENKGYSNGFATWPGITKTNDFPESANATSCIAGFRPNGSNPIIASGVITGYSGGTLPTRLCDQIGQWKDPSLTSYCQRVSCPALNPPTPTSASDVTAWQAWYRSGGATFPSINASRSSTGIQSDANSNSIATGTCNNDLGFFNSPGGQPPTLGCDYLGNWGVVNNACVTTCTSISQAQGSNDNDGHASWAEAGNVPINSSVPGVFLQCQSGYVISGYTGAPTRSCYSAQLSGGVVANLWGAAQNTCINGCWGGATDPAHGISTFPSSTGTKTIIWPDTNFGTYAYMSDVANLDASHFQSGRNNQHYLLSRFCNVDGTWSAPEVLCAANNGQAGNATFNVTGQPIPNNSNSVSVAGTILTGTCLANYTNNGASAPKRQCSYASAANNIDQVFLNLTGGTNDCKLITCPLANGYTSGNSIYSGTTQNYNIGTVVSLNCKSGYGKNMVGVTRNVNNGETNVCNVDTNGIALSSRWKIAHGSSGSGSISVSVTTNRTVQPPSITCDSNGNWLPLVNDCDSCRNCTDGSSPQRGYFLDGQYGTRSGEISYGRCDMRNDSGWRDFCTANVSGCYYTASTFSSASNGGNASASQDGGGSGDRYHGDFSAKCYDGTYYITSAYCDD